MPDEHHLLVFLDVEVEVVEEHRAVVGHGFQAFYLEDLVARVAVHLENDTRIFARGGLDFFHVELLEHLLAARGLAALCHVGREAADKFFQLLLLLFGLLALVLRLA